MLESLQKAATHVGPAVLKYDNPVLWELLAANTWLTIIFWCDKGKPGCMRCQKSKRICAGYRDSFEIFRFYRSLMPLRPPVIGDVLSNTSSELLAHDGTSTLCSSESSNLVLYDSGGTNMTINSASHLRNSFSQPRNLTTIDQQAVCYFLANFVLVPGHGITRGYLDFLIPLLTKSKQQQVLYVAFSSVALAALGTKPNSRTLLPKANILYVKALKQISITLQDPKLAMDDSTLAAVLLLSVFEVSNPSKFAGQISNLCVSNSEVNETMPENGILILMEP